MSEFKAFQSVRVIGGDYKGKSGIIQESVTRNGEVVAYLVAVKNLAHRYVSPENLESVDDPAPAFKEGDRVRILSGEGTGEIGTVERRVFSRDGGEKWIYFVNLGGHLGRQCVEAGLELVKFLEHPEEGKEIDFDLIKAGDKIRTVREFEEGFVLTMEGVASRQRWDGSWMSPGVKGHVVAPKEKGTLATKQTHILVERKEPLDWFVFSRYTMGGGGITVQTLDGKSKKRAEALAKEWNDAEKGTCGNRKVFWAARAGK